PSRHSSPPRRSSDLERFFEEETVARQTDGDQPWQDDRQRERNAWAGMQTRQPAPVAVPDDDGGNARQADRDDHRTFDKHAHAQRDRKSTRLNSSHDQ